ncbi:MAG TPA: hypothetical protein VE981_24345 [Planctomycetota bacterium]|nr:hypothetical protein [Planctomycetota bacterium]
MSSIPVGVWVALGVLAYVGFIAGIIALAAKSAKRRFLKKVEGVSGGLQSVGAARVDDAGTGKKSSASEIEYQLSGRRVRVSVKQAGKHTERTSIRIEGPVYPWVDIFPEGSFERFGKRIGMNKEVQTGDESFDEAVYVDTLDPEEHAERLLSVAEVRTEIRGLVGLGFRVKFSARGVEAYQILSSRSAMDPAKAGQAAEALVRLAAKAPDFGDVGLKPRGEANWAAVPAIIAMVTGILLMAGLSVFASRIVHGSSVAAAILLYGGGAWILYMLALTAWFRGRSYAMRVLSAGGFLGFIAIPGGVGMTMVALNELLDRSPSTGHVEIVRSFRRYKSSRYITVDSWIQADRREELGVSTDVFNSLKTGDRVIVREHAGKFGWAWTEPVTGKVR